MSTFSLNHRSSELVCSVCKQPLEASDLTLCCPDHHTMYVERGGVLVPVSEEASTTRAGIDREEVYSGVLSKIDNLDTITALKALIFNQDYALYDSIFNPARADYLYLLSELVSEHFLIAHWGAGFGTVAHAISDKIARVYALDTRYQHLKFLAKLASLDGKPNILPILSQGDGLPFSIVSTSSYSMAA